MSLHLVTSKEGVPSDATVWRHKQRFGLEEQARAYKELFDRLVTEHFEEFPKQMSDARVVHWDGSVLLSHYTSRVRVNRARGSAWLRNPPEVHRCPLQRSANTRLSGLRTGIARMA
jgi:hypothetical protein